MRTKLPSITSSYYWSATENANNTNNAWNGNFNNGNMNNNNKNNTNQHTICTHDQYEFPLELIIWSFDYFFRGRK